VVVQTSGSTGAPKQVVLSAPAVRAAAQAGLDRLGGPGTWVLALPVTGVGGLQVLVRSIAGGTEPVPAADDLAGAILGLAPGRAYTSIVPTQLQRLDRAGRLGVLARLDAVLLGGAAADPDLVRRARSAGVRVVTTYGMTETCGGCVYDGVGLDGVQVRIGPDGRVHLAGPVLFDGYADDPAATAAVLRDGWLRTGDLGRLDQQGRLELLGRVDDRVISGGVNVHLAAVERAVRSHPQVVDAAVTAVGDDEWGSRVVAVLVVSGAVPSLVALRDHVGAGLPRTWAPRAVRVISALPRLPGGKVDRLAVRALAGGDAGSEDAQGQG